jgi:hypothetical protein
MSYPLNKHADRLGRKVEDLYKEKSDLPIPDGRNYLKLEFAGSVKGEDGVDF